ncbi:MAG: prenyltransferase [Chloroflexota bacterium]|nr:prenyltransferase [Chloroflexota bacterium]
MSIQSPYQSDIEAIIARRHDNGGDYWATADGKLSVGNPFSTLTSVLILTELGLDLSHPVVHEAANLLLASWREDGRYRLAPRGTLYPCYTATTARTLCRLGLADDTRLKRTFEHFLEIQHNDGGWKCNTYKFGRGPETVFSNPGPTLEVLDAFRFTAHLNRQKTLDRAVEFLLDHWLTHKPLGPCRYGIGTLFMKVEYPSLRYNLFLYVHTLSFYDKAKEDPRFLEALGVLESKTINGKMVIENPNRKLAAFEFCRKGNPSDLATKRYREILRNLGRI